jgi:phospholipid/cholesterol/gamma-HCH transport system substrate-binding protein
MRRRLLRSAVLVTAVALAATGCKFDGAYDLPLPGSPVDADHSYEVTAEFLDILNVVPRSPVMVDDVTVGEVTDVERVGWHARVTLRVRDDVTMPDNAIAEIRQVSLLGEKYVALEAPTGESPTGKLSEGDNIGLDDTGRNPEVEEVLGALSFLLSGGGVGQLGTITKELNNVMDGRTDRLRHLLGSLEDVVGTLDDQKADIIHAMESISHLTATLNAEKTTITDALDVAGPAVEVLAAQHDELIAMLKSLDHLGVVGTRVIGASKDNILKSLDHLQPILQKLTEAGDSLAPGLNLLLSFPFPKEASEIVLGDYANTSIRADINLENIIPNGGEGGGLPPIIPDPGQVVSQVVKCLKSGDLASKACLKVLRDADLVKQLKKQCEKKRYDGNPVCTIIEAPGGGGGLPDLPGVPPLGGVLGANGLGDALSSGRATPAPSPAALYGGGS